MKILKMYVNRNYSDDVYYVLVDKIPEITYEKIGNDFVGSAVDKDGNIIFSDFLKHKYDSYEKAFAGREIELKMKDGTIKKIKDHWWDCGCYKQHGEFISIGITTIEDAKDCYVYFSKNINKNTFEKMVKDYYSREKEYEYYEIEKWCRLQYKWYDVYCNGIKLDLMVNKNGEFVNKYTKERVFVKDSICKKYKNCDKVFKIKLFKYEYKKGNRAIKYENSLYNVLRESLPKNYSNKYIRNLI